MATIVRSSEPLTANTSPPSSDAWSWVTRPSLRNEAAPSRSSRTALASRLARASGTPTAPAISPSPATTAAVPICGEISTRSARARAASIAVEAISEDSRVTIRRRQLARKFFADRGTHLAAMVAYFALLSFVPLVFLTLSLFGLAHRAQASDFFIRELKHAFPGTSLDSIIKLVRRVQNNAAALGIIGGIGLLWSSVSLFSALESALNIVYGLPNRRFLQGKLLAAALTASVLVTLFASLVVGALGVSVLKHNLGAFADSPVLAYIVSIGASLTGVFTFLLVVYRWLPNTRVEFREALPGAMVGAVALEASFQGLPIFVRLADVNVTLRTLGGPAILLLWLYVMANVIVFGGEINWWWRERRREAAASVRLTGREEAPPA